MKIELPVSILRQPDYTTCGPTSLHALYAYYGDTISLTEVIDQINKLEGGGTLGVHLAVHALQRGYAADMWVCNVTHWDPMWFKQKTDLAAKLRARMDARGMADNPRYRKALEESEKYLELGGKVHWGDLTPKLIYNVLKKKYPILAGVNGTYMYQCSRETAEGPDDVKGDAFGHFLTVCGCDTKKGTIDIADPLMDNPLFESKYYTVTVHRFIGALFLGNASDDANLLVIRPKRTMSAKQSAKD